MVFADRTSHFILKYFRSGSAFLQAPEDENDLKDPFRQK
jgi:hypothetical protein